MKYSYNWLKELSKTSKTAEEVAELFLTHSFEVEGIEDLAKGLDKVVIGEVLEIEKHPDADRLNVAIVRIATHSQTDADTASPSQRIAEKTRTDAEKNELQIVCGAPNLKVGQKVPVALVGAKLPLPVESQKSKVKSDKERSHSAKATRDKKTAGFFEIKKSKIRGVESNGMICAEDELGLGDDHEGIMVLQEPSVLQSQISAEKTLTNAEKNNAGPEVGQDFAEYMELRDKVLDIDILPNRGHDCLGYAGVALELQALENHKTQDTRYKQISNLKSQISNNGENSLKVEIQTPNCSRYAGVRIKNIKIGPSPQWMQARLKASGMKPINNIVDITNYVMLETGQPLHSFDAKRVQIPSNKISAQGGPEGRQDTNKSQIPNSNSQLSNLKSHILIRQAEDGEKIKLLDGQELELMKDDIVITDGEKPIALAGVMGGLDSGVQDGTTEIILEGANFKSTNIRFTARRYNLQTDAAYRFERDIDPNFVDDGLTRAVELIKELAGGEVMAITDIYPEPVKPWTVELDTNYVRRLLGVEIEDEEIRKILIRLGIDVKNPKSEITNSKQIQNSNNQISKVVMVHGCPSNKEKELKQQIRTYDKHWQPWIKEWLEKNGIKAELPLMPHPWEPVYEEHKKEFEKINIDENSVLIGHSCGANFLVRWLSETNTKIKKLILVAPWNEPDHKIKEKAEFYDISDVDYSFGKNISDGVVIFTSDDEEQIGKNTAKMWAKELEAKLIELKNHGHFVETHMGTVEFPELLNEILEINNLLCTIPTRRRDLRTQEDLIEEVGRIYGYEKIKPKPIQAPVQTPHRNEQRFFERRLKDISAQSGFSEIRSYSFHSEKDAEVLGLKDLKHIELLNPASPEQQMMRNTLAVGILKAGRKSLSHFKEVRIFEVGKTYRVRSRTDADLKRGLTRKTMRTGADIPLKMEKGGESGLPEEILSFAGGVFSKGKNGEQFYEAKGLIDTVLESFGVSGFYYDPTSPDGLRGTSSTSSKSIVTDIASSERSMAMPELHPSRQALLRNAKGEVIGWLGEVNKKTAKHFALKNVRGAIFEIDVDKLRAEASGVNSFQPLAKFPFVERDLSMLVGDKLRVAEVENLIYKAGGKLLQDVDLFDLYQNKETGERSMAFHLLFGDSERTLEAKEVDKAVKKIIEIVESELDVEVRR